MTRAVEGRARQIIPCAIQAVATALLAALVLTISPALATRAAAEERIEHFDSRIAVEPDATIEVIETIRVAVEGDVIKRGIVRDIPTRYRDKRGLQITVGLSIVSVRRDGHDEPYAIEPIANGSRIRIGDKDVLLAHRPTTYEIRYRADREIGFFADFDELYWNVTGNGWTFPIDLATVTIALPPGASLVQVAAYTGPAGAQGRDFDIESFTGARFRAVTKAGLAPYEGFTVAIAWPKGFVTPPSRAARGWWLVKDNAPAVIGWIGLVAVTGFYGRAWCKVGRDPAPGVVVPQFRPPDGLSPAAARYVRRQDFDDKTFSAALIGLAVKGHLKISDRADGYRLEPLANPARNLTAGETKLAGALGSAPLDLDQANHRRIGAARSALAKALADEYRGVAFVLNRGWFYAGAAMSVAVLGLTYALASEDVGGSLVAGLFFLGWWTFIIVSARGALGRLAEARGFAIIARGIAVLFLLPFILVGLVIPVLAIGLGHVSAELMAAAAAAGLLALVNLVFFWLLSAPTRSGRELLDKIEGFRMYLATTEEERLNVLNPPQRTPDLFERYLPFALALGCAHEWSAKFTGILAAAGISSPSWYSGSNWDPGNPTRFASGLGDGLATRAAAAASPPGSSSGSGGGGSSGGGGGGGGGSGW